MSQSRCTTKHLAIAPGATVLQSAACLVAVVCGGSYAVAQAASDNGSGVSGAAAPAGILPFDLLSSLLLMVAAVIGLAVVLFSLGYISPHNREHSSTARRGLYLGWLLTAIGATIGVALAQNLLQLVVFVELLTVCAWGLVSFYGDDASRRAGFKGLLITGTGTVCFIAVLLLLYAGGAPDAFGFDTLFRLEGPLSVAVFVLLLVGVATKAGLFPFFTWVLDATHGPITSIGYLCSGGLGVAIVYMIARLLTANAGMVQQPAVALGLLARLTIIVGIVLLFFQQDLKRLVALFALVNLGHVIGAIAAGAQGSAEAFNAGLLHLVPYSLGTALLFLSVGMISWATGTSQVQSLTGAMHPPLRMAALGFFVGVFTLTGVPPFAGFWTKLQILGSASLLSSGGAEMIVCTLVESTVALGFFLWMGHRVFFGPSSEAVVQARKTPRSMRAVVIALAILCVLVPFCWFSLFHQLAAGM